MEQLWQLWLMADEPVGVVLGLVIVACLIRQNLWAWPLGVAYVVVLVTPLLEARLYANLALHVLCFLPMNLYGWYFWLFGKKPHEVELPVTYSSRRLILTLLTLCVVGTLAVGTSLALYTDAALTYWDSGVLVSSLIAMWLTARKKIENWIFWFFIDIVSVGVYWAQGLPYLALLYFIYLGMAVMGWQSWKRSMTPPSSVGAASRPRPAAAPTE